MASYWALGITAVIIALVTYGIPLLLAEVFPWQSLWKQRHAKPTVTTASYRGRTALITGANGAFGSRAAKLFAHRDVDTLVLVDVMDCAGVKQQIETELAEAKKPQPKILVWKADMMTFAGCQQVAKKARELQHLDHVLMTMGMLSFSRRESPEGWETCKFFPLSVHHIISSKGNKLSSFIQQFKSTSFRAPFSGFFCSHTSNPLQRTPILR